MITAGRVEADAEAIVKRLRDTRVTLTALMAEYHCGHPRIMAAVLSVITKRQWQAIAKRKNAQGGVATRFQAGLVPWNKGVKGLRMSPATEFKPGCMRGQAARNWRPIGTITVRRDQPPRRNRDRANARPGPSRRFIKIRDDGPGQRRWIPYARHLWERAYGPVPAGHIVVHADGDTMNDAVENLIVVDRRTHMKRLHAMRPEAIALARKRAGRASRARHAINRHSKRRRGPQVVVFDCQACGARFGKRPEQCPKCGTGAFERFKIPA